MSGPDNNDFPRSAYVHVPFCRRRCGYCNFTLVAGRDDLVPAYLAAVEREMSWLGEPHAVETLFFGGGTPTWLDPTSLSALMSSTRRWFPLTRGGELSVEANPADLDEERVTILVDYGATRISLGAQSFNALKLAALERDHLPDHIYKATQLVRQRGLTLAVDLIFAAPGETLDGWHDDLSATMYLAPDHVSTYGLTFEKGTSFWSRVQGGGLSRADEELERAMYLAAIDRLSAAGFEHYEVSNFARPGRRCRHNERYWLGESYYAVGPGAARYVGGRRETNHRSTTTYLRRVLSGESPVAESESLSPEDRARELLVFALRRIEGVHRQWFEERTGFGIEQLVGRELPRLIDQGLFSDDERGVRLTREGLLVSDAIWPKFLRT